MANRLPPTLFQAYVADGADELRAIPLTTMVSDVPADHRVVLRCIRNTDINTLRSPEVEIVARDENPVAALFDLDFGRHQPLGRAHLVNDETLREVVANRIVSFLTEHAVTTPILAGISGGGDSNTLVNGLTQFVEASGQPAGGVVCFTLAMEPLWPESAVDRARALCERAGFEHRVLYAQDMADLLGMNQSPAKLWETFRRDHGADTVHFFGTFFVNLVGRRLCTELGASNLAVGYNREDLTAELLFCLLNGRRPLPYPVRRMGEVDCLFPLWEIPKHLLDACYPRYSASNYTERVDSTTPQRSAIYVLAHTLDALGPQLSLSLLKGVSGLMNEVDGWEELAHIEGTPLMRTGLSDHDTEKQVVDLLREFFPDWYKAA
ncbi:hypothetical protein ACPZ19_50515 [Amycolatopsis lurida]